MTKTPSSHYINKLINVIQEASSELGEPFTDFIVKKMSTHKMYDISDQELVEALKKMKGEE